MSTKTKKLSTKNKQLILEFNNMRQFTLTLKAFYELTEVGETYDAIRSQFPSMDIEKYLNIHTHESTEEFTNHAKLLLWIYIHEEHGEILHARLNPHKEEDPNRVILTIEADKLKVIEPRLFEDGRLKSLITLEILQEVKHLMLNTKQLEDLVNIVNYVNQHFTEPSASYPTLGMTQADFNQWVKTLGQLN